MKYASNESYILDLDEFKFAITAAGLDTLVGFSEEETREPDREMLYKILAGLFRKNYIEGKGEKQIHMLSPFSDFVSCLKSVKSAVICDIHGAAENRILYYITKDCVIGLETADGQGKKLKFTFLEGEDFLKFVLDSFPEDIKQTDDELFREDCDSRDDECLATLTMENPFTGQVMKKTEIAMNGLCCIMSGNGKRMQYTTEHLKSWLSGQKG